MKRSHLDAPSVIRVKRDGGRLADDQIDWVVDAYTRGDSVTIRWPRC
jgi:thymidine phosphorylase